VKVLDKYEALVKPQLIEKGWQRKSKT